MNDAQAGSHPITTLADVAALEAASRRVGTPCGDGEVVWHLWGEGPPVVLLHGGSGSWTHWVRNIGPLAAAGRTVCVPDVPGFGDSAVPPGGRDADAVPPWIEVGLEALFGAAPVDLVGFSFGALISGLFAAGFGSRVQRLVLIGAPALSSEPMPPLGLRPWDHLPEGPARDAVLRHNLAALMLAREASIDELSVRLHAANLVRDRMRRRRLAHSDLLVRSLRGIGCPVAGIWGSEDVIGRGRHALIESGLAQAPDFRTLTYIARAGHWVQYEDAAEFNAMLAAALALPLRKDETGPEPKPEPGSPPAP